MSKKLAIGIDLGTTFSCVAVFRNGKVEVIPNDRGNQTTPSCVAFTDTEWLVGEAAKSQAFLNPVNTIFNAKRMVGRCSNDSVLLSSKKYQAFEIIDKSNHPMIKVTYKGEVKELYPEQILAIIFTKLKKSAEAYLGQVVTDAVITVPATFNFFQRQAINDAAIIAGLTLLRFVVEPAAAAIAYSIEKPNVKTECNVIVVDCGGGCTNVSTLFIEEGVVELRAAFHTHLGGEDFVDRLLGHFINEFKRKFKKDISENKKSVSRLRNACEVAKISLSSITEACIELDSLFEGISFYTKITRTKFEEMCADLFRRVLDPVETTIRDGRLAIGDIHEVILVGGSTRIPKIQKLLQDFFNGKNLNKSLNPDQAAACGAAVQAACLCGVSHPLVEDFLFLPVLPLSVGIETIDGIMDVVMKRNITVPQECSNIYTLRNAVDGLCFERVRKERTNLYVLEPNEEIVIPIRIFEGERAMVANNILLGELYLTISSSKSSRVIELEITFDSDRNFYSCVSATEIGNSASIMARMFVGKKRFSDEQFECIIKEAEKLNADFAEQKAIIAAREHLERYTFSVKNQMEETKRLNVMYKSVLAKCTEIIDWLDDNASHLEKQEIECHQKELEDMCRPIVFSQNNSTGKEIQQTVQMKIVSSLESALKESEAQLKGLEAKFVSSRHHEVELATQISTLETSSARLKYILKLSEFQNTELKNSTISLTARLETSETHARVVADRLVQAEARVQELETRLSQELQPFWVVT